MKKEYINPKMAVVKVQTMTVIAASETVSKGGTTSTYDSSGLFDSDDNEEW